MNTEHPVDEDSEITARSYLYYFGNIWVLGIKMIFKALIGWIMICLMLGLPAFLFQFIPLILAQSEQTRQIATLIAMAIYFVVITPIAFYVGGSTVGFCPCISAAHFARKDKKES
jgi:hypothetical protein